MLTHASGPRPAKHKVVIAGNVFYLVSDEPDQVLRDAVTLVDHMMHDAMRASACQDVAKIATLVALRLAQQHVTDHAKLLTLITENLGQVTL